MTFNKGLKTNARELAQKIEEQFPFIFHNDLLRNEGSICLRNPKSIFH